MRRGPDQFRAWYEANGRQPFSPVFNSHLESLSFDSGLAIGQRFWAWLVRHAWGNYSNIAVNGDAKPVRMADCARDLGIEQSRLSTCVHTLSRYVTYSRDGLAIVRDPIRQGELVPKKCSGYTSWLKDWLSHHPDQSERLASAKLVQKQVLTAARKDYREANKKRKENKEGNFTLSRNKNLRKSVRSDPPILITRSKKVEAAGRQALLSCIDELCQHLNDWPTDSLTEQILDALGDCPVVHLRRAIEARIGRIRSLGILPYLASTVSAVHRKEAVTPDPVPAVHGSPLTTEQIERELADPSLSGDLRQYLLDELKERKHGIQTG